MTKNQILSECSIAIAITTRWCAQFRWHPELMIKLHDKKSKQTTSRMCSYIKNRFRFCSRFVVGKEGFCPNWENAHFVSCKLSFSENVSRNTDISVELNDVNFSFLRISSFNCFYVVAVFKEKGTAQKKRFFYWSHACAYRKRIRYIYLAHFDIA